MVWAITDDREVASNNDIVPLPSYATLVVALKPHRSAERNKPGQALASAFQAATSRDEPSATKMAGGSATYRRSGTSQKFPLAPASAQR